MISLLEAFIALMLFELLDRLTTLVPSERIVIYIIIMIFYFIDTLVNYSRYHKIYDNIKDIKQNLKELTDLNKKK